MPLFKRVRQRDRLCEGDRIIACYFGIQPGGALGGGFYVGYYQAAEQVPRWSSRWVYRSAARVKIKHKFVWHLASPRCNLKSSKGAETPGNAQERATLPQDRLIWQVHVTREEWEDAYTMRQVCQKLLPFCQELCAEHYSQLFAYL